MRESDSGRPTDHHVAPTPETDQTMEAPGSGSVDRRRFLNLCAKLGVSGSLLGGAALAAAQDGAPARMSDELLRAAAESQGLEFTPEERDLMAESVAGNLESIQRMRQIHIGNDVAPALVFDPLVPGIRNVGETVRGLPGPRYTTPRTGGPGARAAGRPGRDPRGPAPPSTRPADPTDLAFQPVSVLSELVRTRKVSSRELTELYLARLRRHDPQLSCVITYTDDLARRQAERADREIAAGRRRGPLHGIPWGAKDILATRGITTTWGAEPFKGQVPKEDAAVVRRLEEAGAVLVAKTSVGALAWGDVWYGGVTKNPWKLDQGSSGSSAGSASATAAGLLGFSIGTETLGSIVSPCTRCGASGLRPTFGRVARTGAMALCWSLDKIGPIARCVEDLALVFDAIRGPDGADPSVIEAPFDWKAAPDWRTLRVGYDRAAFERARDEKSFDDDALAALRGMSVDLVPVTLPDMPVGDMLILLEVEAAAAFDELTRSNQDSQLTRQVAQAWPNVFRAARLVPAVEYVQANRLRTMLMRRFDDALAGVDLYVTPSFGGTTLRATNLTGHPTVVMPNGFRADGTPVSISFTGRLFGEAALLSMARAYQEETGWHRRRPNLG